MRRRQAVFALEQRMRDIGWRGLEDIESDAGELAAFERLVQHIKTLDQAAARQVDQIRTSLHPCDPLAIDETDVLRGRRAMDRNEVRRRKQLVEVDQTRAG